MGLNLENKDLLDSWKAISQYLDRNIRTCYRWHKELGLPIHRIDDKSKRSKVFAYKSEICDWLKEKANSKEIQKKSFFVKNWVILGLVSSLTVISVVFTFLYFTRIKTPFSSESPSLAVLPFKHLNASEYDEYFSEGIANELINSLTMVNGLKVIPWVAVSRFQEDSQESQQIGEKLNVDYVIKGNIKKRDNRIIFEIQLIRTKDSKTIWEEQYNDKLEGILFIQDNICSNIIEKLNLKLANNLLRQLNIPEALDPRAFDSYLKGNYVLNKLNKNENNDPWKLYHQGKYYWGKCTQESNLLAINFFKKAIEIDDNFAQAYIGLAHSYANYVNFNWDYKLKWLDKSENLLKKAQKLYPDLPEYYSTLTEIYLLKNLCFNKNTEKIAYKLAQEGIKKHPNHSQLNSIVGYCYFLKFSKEGIEADFEKALDYKEKSFWLNPYAFSNIVYAELLMLNKEFNKAIMVCNNIRKHDSTSLSIFRLGEIYYYMGDLDKSKELFEHFRAPFDINLPSLFYLGLIASKKGETNEVQRIVQEINLLSPGEYRFSRHLLKLASIYFGLRNKEMGYKFLESFFKENSKKDWFICQKYIDIDSNFSKVKEEEKFKEIIKGKGENI